MDASKAQRRKRRLRAFTLIELLTVVVIIGLLAGLITAAIIKARTYVKEKKIRAEIDLMSKAVETYKNKFNAYPPDMTGLNAAERQALIVRHLQTAFPKYKPTPGMTLYQQFVYDVDQATGGRLNVDAMDASSALIFWLGGIPEGADPLRLTGFSANPASPFQNSNQAPSRIPPMFSEYRPEQVALINGQLRYYPDTPLASEVGQAPYVYFRNRGNTYNAQAQRWTYNPPDGTASETVTPIPKWDGTNNAPGDWANYSSFQILCAGLDGKFGTTTDGNVPYYPKGGNYGPEHLDNMANFCESNFDGEMD